MRYGLILAISLSMAADIGRVYPPEIHLLKKEIEIQGDLLNQEILERKEEIDLLRLEFNSFKHLLEELQPGFLEKFERIYNLEKNSWNPEFDHGKVGKT